jgi:nucleoside-diphosphate-sugar epimerase
MKIVVIGATGHVGGYLVPRLVRAGHDVVSISRGGTPHYRQDPAWNSVTRVTADRDAEDAAGTFAGRVADLGPDVVIDMICFTADAASQLVDALRGRVQRLVMCTTIWTKGTLAEVPAGEDDGNPPWGDYGTGKAAIESLLVAEAEKSDGLRSIALRPGHISGPGWHIINPQGNLDLEPWERLARGDELVLPSFGLETVHHVHPDDVAQAFELAVTHEVAGFAAYNTVSPRALVLKGFAEAIARGFGQEPNLTFLPFEEFRAGLQPEFGDASFEHIARSHSMSIAKAERELGYRPRYSSLRAVAEAVNWLREDGQLDLGGRTLSV